MAKKKNIDARQALNLANIILRKQHSFIDDDYPIFKSMGKHLKLGIMSSSINCIKIEKKEASPPEKLFSFRHSFGLRVLSPDDEEKIIAEIELEYDAIYQQPDLEEVISDKSLKDFAPNVAHNLWPFWREHVSSISQKMGIPSLVIPLKPPME